MVKKPSLMSLLWKMRLRSFKKGWAQFLAVIAIGAIAVTLFVGLQANAASLESRSNQVYLEGNLASLWVTTNHYDSDDEAYIKKQLSEDDTMESRLYLPLQLATSNLYLSVSHSMPNISKPYGEISKSNDSTDYYYFYLDESFKKPKRAALDAGFELGEEVELSMDISSYGLSKYADLLVSFVKEGGNNVFASGKVEMKAKITGFMQHPENICKKNLGYSLAMMSDMMFKEAFYNVLENNYSADGVKLIEMGLESILGFHTKSDEYYTEGNQYLISVKDSSKVDVLEAKIRTYFEKGGNAELILLSNRAEMPFVATIVNDVNQARQFTFVFPFVFFLVGILVTLTTISQHILQERTQIGTLKALGVSKKMIYWHYSSLTLLLVGIGTLIGEIVGPILIPKLLNNKYSIFYNLPTLTYQFPILAGLLTALAFIGISVLVTILVCHKEIALNPVESMRPKKPNNALLSMKGANKKKGVKGLSARMAFRNIRLNIGKSLMVVAGVMGCTALLVTGFGIEDTIYYGIDHDMNSLQVTDIAVTFNGNREKEAAIKDFLSLDGVESAEASYSSSTTIYKTDGAQVSNKLYLLPDESKLFKVTFAANEVAISEKIARNGNISVGDEINFTYAGLTYTCKVGVIFEAFYYHGLLIHENNEVFKNVAKFTYTGCHIYLKDGADPHEVNDQIKKISYVLSSQTKIDWVSTISNAMGGILTMTNAVKIFAILLAIVVLYNLALMNFKERARDIATLKVLGFKRSEIALSLLLESLTLTLVGTILGMALGYPFLLLVMGTNVVELVDYLYFIKAISYVYGFLLTFGVAVITNVFLVYRTNKIKMVESLKSVE